VLEPNLVDADLKFLCEKHRHGCVYALAHLNHRHHERDGARPIDPDERIRREFPRRRRLAQRRRQRERKGEVNHQTAAKGHSGLQEVAAVQADGA
jgi:hypothetical protein